MRGDITSYEQSLLLNQLHLNRFLSHTLRGASKQESNSETGGLKESVN